MSSPVAKFLVALLGAVATLASQAITLGLVAGTARVWVSLTAGFVTLLGTAVGVYFVPNTPTKA